MKHVCGDEHPCRKRFALLLNDLQFRLQADYNAYFLAFSLTLVYMSLSLPLQLLGAELPSALQHAARRPL